MRCANCLRTSAPEVGLIASAKELDQKACSVRPSTLLFFRYVVKRGDYNDVDLTVLSSVQASRSLIVACGGLLALARRLNPGDVSGSLIRVVDPCRSRWHPSVTVCFVSDVQVFHVLE